MRVLGADGAAAARAATRDLSITRTLRVVRLIRVFRVLKVGAQYKKLEVISAVVTQSRDILGVLVFMLTLAGALPTLACHAPVRACVRVTCIGGGPVAQKHGE